MKKKFWSYSYITEICDGTGVRDREVGRFRKNVFELFRPRVNFDGKQKDDLKNFVPEGHPTPQSFSQLLRGGKPELHLIHHDIVVHVSGTLYYGEM